MNTTIIDCTTGNVTTRPLTDAELAQQQADSQAAQAAAAAAAQEQADDTSDRSNRSTLFAQLKQDYALLIDTTQNVTQAQYRAILARVLRCLWFFLQIAMRRGL